MTDVVHEINAVQRQVGTRVLEAGDARTVTVSRTYEAPIDDVWDAITNPERIPRWFLPVSGDLRPGGRFQLEGNAGGEIRECDPPRRLALTWEFGGDVSLLGIELASAGAEATTLTLSHAV